MESAAIYTIAARYRARALTILTVSDHIKTGAKMDSAQREKGFGDMVRIGLDTAIADAASLTCSGSTSRAHPADRRTPRSHRPAHRRGRSRPPADG